MGSIHRVPERASFQPGISACDLLAGAQGMRNAMNRFGVPLMDAIGDGYHVSLGGGRISLK